MSRLDTPSGFSDAYRSLSPLAYSTAYRVLGDAAAAEDVVQDVFPTLWRDPVASSTPAAAACRATWR